jgi:hypothetical protein
MLLDQCAIIGTTRTFVRRTFGIAVRLFFPGGADRQSEKLQQEGFALHTTEKAPKVKQFKASLVRFDTQE